MSTASGRAGGSLFLGAAIAIAVAVFAGFAGFARNYYLRAWIGTRAITPMVHVHGLVMTAWIVLFVIQALLVAKHRVDLHRGLGIAGAGLAAVVFALSVYTIAGSIQRQQPGAGAKVFAELFVAFDGISLLVFACLVIAALANRRRPESRKRLMLGAGISLLPPAFGLLVAYFTHDNVEIAVLGLMYASAIACVLLDSWRHHRFHPALVVPALMILASNQLTYVAQIVTP